jgi:hypothetical protein
MNGRLIRLEFPDAVQPAKTSDGGADMVLPKAGGGYERCWQSKHFPNVINWTQCKKSLAAARRNWNPARYTFCFPLALTVGEQKTFDRHFRGADVGIVVDQWNGEELQARLVGSDAGQRVARTFFQDVELDKENVNRAIEVGGRLDSTDDALDRLGNVGGFLASRDAFFSYPAATHEAGGPAQPLTPGTVMSVQSQTGDVVNRFDVVPRDREAMERYGPEFVIQPVEGQAGADASARLQAALQQGEAVAVDAGLDLTFNRLPPGLDHLVGKRLTGGRIEFGAPTRVRRPVPPWKARLRVRDGTDEASVDVVLRQTADVPDNWDWRSQAKPPGSP